MRPILLLAALLPAAAGAQPAGPAPAMVATAVLARAVQKGERLSATDLVVEPRPASVARGALGVGDAAGKEATRALAAGAPLRPTDVIRAQLVRRGEGVLITVRAGTLSITTNGRALTGGGEGDAVRVVSLSTNRTLDAVVEASGRVRVNML